MFPPYVLVLFLFVLPLLCFLLGKLPLSFLALEKRLYLREQDTGQGFHLVIGYPCTVVVELLFPCHRSRPPVLKLTLVKQIALEYSAVPGDETAPCVLGDLIGGAGVVQNDLREYIVRSAAHTEVQVILDLSWDDVGIWALGGKNEVDTKGPPQPRYSGEPTFNLRQQFRCLYLLGKLRKHTAPPKKRRYNMAEVIKFDRYVVQAKLLMKYKVGIWEGLHTLTGAIQGEIERDLPASGKDSTAKSGESSKTKPSLCVQSINQSKRTGGSYGYAPGLK
ncbi:Uncharacterised protein [uncultured Flavonifractor sp.]|nr:Uncharacterised protein [uncultured Flavonifractor sp.]